MAGPVSFLVLLVFVGVLALIFGKADTKRELLNQIGLDLSKESYDSLKEREFARSCLKALMNATNEVSLYENTELCLIKQLLYVLNNAVYGEERNNLSYLGVQKHFLSHCHWIVYKRHSDLCYENAKPIMQNVDFKDKEVQKTYVKLLWQKYNLPWPQDWNKKL